MTSSLTNVVTLTRHILEHDKHTEQERRNLTILFSQIQLACKVTSNAVRRAGIEKNFGYAGYTNVQGEEVKKLDMVANSAFVTALQTSKQVCVMASEEEDEAIVVEGPDAGQYIVCFDPLDGSSNIDANVSIGSIFAIFKLEPGKTPSQADCLRRGSDMVAAGYALYGSSTMLVVSTGHGVQGFTLDNSLGEFVLTHANITIPKRGKIYSINEGNSYKWDAAVTSYVDLVKGKTGRKSYSLRYIGSMVADVHRTLLYGGIFMYPADSSAKNGKLRYLYEVAPLSFIVEQAGGRSSNGKMRALDIEPNVVHMRVPCFMGSEQDVQDLEECFAAHTSSM